MFVQLRLDLIKYSNNEYELEVLFYRSFLLKMIILSIVTLINFNIIIAQLSLYLFYAQFVYQTNLSTSYRLLD